MMSFLTLRSTFSNGPLVKAELLNLRRHTATQVRALCWLWRTLAVIAALLASISLWLDMPDSPRSMILFPLIILGVYIVHFNVFVKTLTVASHSVAREAASENWDNLVLTGVDARKIVLAKWSAVIRFVWRDYVWIAFLKLGLATGLVKYFEDIFIGACYKHLVGGLCYVNGYPYYSQPPYRYVFGNLVSPMMLSAIVLILFSLAEAGLLAALGICFGSVNRRHRIMGMGGAATFRGILALIAIVVWIVLGQHSYQLYIQSNDYSQNPNPAVSRWNMTIWERQELLGSAQLVLSPLADGGALLATDLLRPYMIVDHLMERLLITLISLASFGGLIWLSLRIAQALAVRQHALRPREREHRVPELAT